MENGKNVILTVDDDNDLREAVRTILEAEGYAVYDADSAESGLKEYAKCKPDIVLVDLMMEEVDSGMKFIKELKLLGNKAPVFLLSGVGDGMCNNSDCFQLGFAGILQKPFQREQLLHALNSKLKKK